ncbi:MAG: LamG domain-containing protein [Planctomycetota bacterium]
MARRLLFLTSVVWSVSLVGGVSADEIEWMGAVDTSWGNSNNWDPAQVPGVDDVALFDDDSNDTTCVVSDSRSVKVVHGPGYRDIAVFDANGAIVAGAPSVLTIGGGATLTVDMYLRAANDADGWAILNVESGGTLNVAETIYFCSQGIATMNINGGAVNGLGLMLGYNGGAALANFNSGTIDVNGVSIGSNARLDIEAGTLTIHGGDYRGSIASMTYDGEIAAYDGRGRIVSVYTADPCQTVVTASPDLTVAYDPNIIGDTDVVHDALLSWKAGDGALSHNVYLSTNFDDVNDATSPADDCFVGNYAIDHNYIDETDHFLEFDSTIYWRVDEVGASTTSRGNIWCFSTDNGRARNPVPADAAVDVNVIDLELEWDRAPGRVPYTVKYNVYFSESYDEVNDVAVDDTGVAFCIASNQDANAIVRSVVKLDTTYYWRVDTKAIADACTVRGDVWSCTTVNNYDVDNFESYINKETLEIYWDDTGGVLDYWDLNLNYPYSGIKCVEIEYWTYDSPYYGGMSRTHIPTTLPWNSKAPTWADWTFDGTAEAISLWFSPGGDPNLAMGGIDELYARITDSSSRLALVHYTDNWPVSDFDNGGPQEWNIGLQEFVDDNPAIDLTNVKSFEVGFLDGLGNPPAQTGQGWIYFDQIRLYARRCILRYGQPVADLNDDCVADLDDVKIMAGDWLECDYSITGVAVDPCDANLVAHWKLDGNALDSGPDGHHGTVVGNPAWDPNGMIDGAIVIPDEGGGDYIDCGGGKDKGEPDTWADITGEITVAAWVKPFYDCWWCNVSTVVNKGREVAWDLHKSATNVPGLQQYHRTISFYVDVPEVPWYGIHAKTDLFDLRWHHVAGVYKIYEPGVSSEVKVYTDGGEEGGLVCSGSPIGTSDKDVRIGDTYSLIGWSHPWFGHIDDVRIYDRALSHAEIVGIVKEAPLGPLASYEFEVETGGITPDSSGGHDGTLVNGASIVYDVDRDSNVLELNGIDQYVDCGGGHDLNEPNCTDEPANCTWADITGQFTFTAWVKPDISEAGNYRAVVFGKGDDGGYHRDYPSEPNRPREGWSMLRLNSDNVVTAAVTSTPTNLTPVSGIVPNLIDVNIWDGKWHHIAARFEHFYVELYIDGIKATSYGTIWEPKYPSTTNYPIWIGANVGEVLGGGAYADGYHGRKGRIDDVRIYDRALTEFEIANVMGGADVYVPLTLLANLYDEELVNNKIINFRDYRILADVWLEDETFPFRD